MARQGFNEQQDATALEAARGGCFAARRNSGSVVGAGCAEQAARVLERLTVGRTEQAVVTDFDSSREIWNQTGTTFFESYLTG